MRIFLTDYASYNNGSQFEFGHWVDLSVFDEADDVYEYIEAHLAEADRVSPLDTPREEYMITDYEDFPEYFYSECMDFYDLFKWRDFCEDRNVDWDDDDDLISLWNEYCGEENIDGRIYLFDNIEELIGSVSTYDAFMQGVYSDIKLSDDYIYINGYGNIVSTSRPMNLVDEDRLIEWIINS